MSGGLITIASSLSNNYNCEENFYKYASYPDWRISPHADRRPRLSSQFVAPSAVQRTIDFSLFDFGGLPLGQSSPKGKTHRSTILQNFSPIAQTVYEIHVTKLFHRPHTSTHAGDIPYKKILRTDTLQTNKQ